MTRNELLEMEAKDAGITVQQLCQQKVVIKRQLRQLGFEIPTNLYHNLGLLTGVLACEAMTDRQYLVGHGVPIK